MLEVAAKFDRGDVDAVEVETAVLGSDCDCCGCGCDCDGDCVEEKVEDGPAGGCD